MKKMGMRMRIIFNCVIIFCFLFFVFCLSGAVPVGFEAEDNFAFTAAEKVAVLEKAEETLKWVKSLPKTALDAMPPEIFRTKITPLELMQAAALLREANQIMTSVKLREIFSLLNPTPSECFDIEERLGAAVLDSFKNDAELPQSKVGGGGGWDGVGLNSADFIRKGAEKFLRDDLTAAERIAIMNSPKTPLDIMKTADVLAATGRAALARGYLKRFLDTKNTPAECAEIVDKIGTTRLMQISVSRKLMPRGKDAVARILQEAKKYWQDKNVIAKAADNLTIKFDQRYQNNDRLSLDDFNPPLILPESLKTLQTIWKGEHVSAENLLSKLANINDNNRADEIIAALLSIGGDVKESLAVSLNSDNPVLLKHVVRGLGVAVSRDEVFLLYPAAFSQKKTVPDEIKNEAYNIILSKTVGKNKNNIRNDIKKNAVITLYNRARDYYFRNRHLRANEDGVIRFWNWNDNKSCAEYIQLSLPDAYRLFAYRYARLAYEIADKGGEGFEIVQRFYVAALFDYVSYSNGIDQPLDLDSSGLLRIVSSLPLVQLDRIITDAIRERHFEVARVAAKIWARVGNSNSFVNSGSQPHPLIRAVSASDRRLRFTALETIMQLNPSVPYQGSSLVTDALVWFARSEGQKTVVVVHPKLSEASRFYGHFIPLGYAGELAVTCRKGFMLAAESPDVELVVVDSIFPESTVSEFVQTLRSDNRTHDIPVAIYKAEPQRKPKVLQNIPNAIELKLMQQTDRNQPDSSFVTSLSLSYPRSADDAAARFVEADLLQKTSTIIVPAEIRLEQAKKSLNWIKQTIANTKTGQKVYHYENADELILRAIQNSKHVIEGLAIATEIKSATMQLAIFNTAADATLPITIRQQAAQFFETSIKTHGVMPRGKQIQSLYDRYNASEFEPKESQDLLNRMIDIIEEKALKQKSK